jgi:ribosome-associated protein
MKKTPKRQKRQPAAPRLSSDLTAGIAAALDKKALDVLVLDLRKASAFTDFFVICTGANIRQVQAIADAVQQALGRQGTKPALVEGYERAEWVLIDYFDFIFHVFTPSTREFYALERLWGDAERIEVSA